MCLAVVDMLLIKNRFELLANELLHEIFDYLPTVDILQVFNQLNSRFSRLLAQRMLKIDLSHLSKGQYEHVHKRLRWNRIHSLKVSQQWTVNVLSRVPFHAMSHLRTLILSHVPFNDLRALFESRHFAAIQRVNTLKILSTQVGGLDAERIFVLEKLFCQMPELRRCHLPFIDANDFDDLAPTSSFEELTLDHCTLVCLGK